MTATKRMSNLVLIRISDSGAIKELEKKVRETARMYPDMEGASRLEALGASPLVEPSKVDGQVVTAPGFRAVVFRIPGTWTWALLALGSATKANIGEDDNAFVTLLAETLATRPVQTLWVADFARLLRSIDYLSASWKAVRSSCRQVRHGGATIDTSSPTAEIQFLFEALSAAAEARWVVTRTLRGKMRSFVDGKCPLSKHGVPAGYVRTKSRELELCPENARPIVTEIVRVLGDSSLTNRERVDRVADLGATSPELTRAHGRRTTIAKVRNAGAIVARWYGLLDTWRTGRWVVDFHIPMLLDTTQFDLPVEILDEPTGGRTWRMTYDLTLPHGGWATDEEFDEAMRLRDERAAGSIREGGASAGSRRKPFCGFPSWQDDTYDYGLFSKRAGYYALRRRPVKRAVERRRVGGQAREVRRGWGRSTRRDGEEVGVIRAEILHQAVAEGLVAAAVDGLKLQSASAALLSSDDEILDDLRSELAALQRRARNARRNANEAVDETERQDYRRDAAEARAAAEELERDLLRVAGASQGGRLPVDVDAVARGLGAVAGQGDYVPGAVADALQTIITGFEVVPEGRDQVRWRARLRVPVAGGSLVLGPVDGLVTLGTSREHAARRNGTLASRAGLATALLMRDGLDVAGVAQKLEIRTSRRVAQTIRDHLRGYGLSSEAVSELVAVAPASARRAVWHHLHRQPWPVEIDPRFALHVVQTYCSAALSVHSHRDRQAANLTAVIERVRGRGGWVPPEELDDLCRQAGISRLTLHDYVHGRQRGRYWAAPVLCEKRGGVSLVACPHAACSGWATTVALLPEVPLRLLCEQCRRMPCPQLGKVAFPEEYLTVHREPSGQVAPKTSA